MMNRKLEHTPDTDADPVSALVDGLNKLTLPNKNTDSETVKEKTGDNQPALRQQSLLDDRGNDHKHLIHTRTDLQPRPQPKADQDHHGKKQDDSSSQSGRINANRDKNSDRPVRDLSFLSSKYTGYPHRNCHSKEDAEYTKKSTGFGRYSTNRNHQGASGWGNLETEGSGKMTATVTQRTIPDRRHEFPTARPGRGQQPVWRPCMRGGSHLQNIDSAASDRRYADSKLAGTEGSHKFDPSDFPENERHDRLLQFLEKSAPSKTRRRSDGIGKIKVLSPSHVHKELDKEGLETAWKKLTDSTDAINFSDVKDLAVSFGVLRGIWLLFVKTWTVDQIWEQIASATVNGELGISAKVTPIDDRPEAMKIYSIKTHVISVYTKDFTDYSDVIAIEGKIRNVYQSKIIFKPGIYAKLGIYYQNKYRLKPGIYESEWNAMRKMFEIRSYIN